MKIFNIKLSLKVLVLSLLLAVSCSKESGTGDTEVTAEISSPQITANTLSQFLYVRTTGAWSISITYTGTELNWCTPDPATGSGNTNVILRFSENTTTSDRSAEITVTSGGSSSKVTVLQKGKTGGGQNPDPDPDPNPQPIGSWLELPAGGGNSDCQVVTHYATVNSKSVRNYSMMFDKKEKIAYWVAYPHHPSYIGSSGRTDDWAYDPKIAQSSQPTYFSGINSFDRGHQIPSGDRTCNTATNRQTFYFTNMTPQMSRLNQDMWNQLENQVRNWMQACDTLYVVTGAILKTPGKNEPVNYVNDNNGVKVAIPNYYYKVLLRLKAGKYDAIGFWVEHRSYGNIAPNASMTKSIDEIETLTGFDFFKSLPASVQNTIEAEWLPRNWGL